MPLLRPSIKAIPQADRTARRGVGHPVARARRIGHWLRSTTETDLSKSPKDLQQEKAEASFKRKETQAREATKAMADYHAATTATREKTARLRELRLAKEEADRETAAKAPAKPAAKPKKAAAKKKR